MFIRQTVNLMVAGIAVLLFSGCASVHTVRVQTLPPVEADIYLQDNKPRRLVARTSLTDVTEFVARGKGYKVTACVPASTNTPPQYLTLKDHASHKHFRWQAVPGVLFSGAILGLTGSDPDPLLMLGLVGGALICTAAPTQYDDVWVFDAGPIAPSNDKRTDIPLRVDRNVADRLREIKALRDEGILSEDEYERKKRELIDRL